MAGSIKGRWQQKPKKYIFIFCLVYSFPVFIFSCWSLVITALKELSFFILCTYIYGKTIEFSWNANLYLILWTCKAILFILFTHEYRHVWRENFLSSVFWDGRSLRTFFYGAIIIVAKTRVLRGKKKKIMSARTYPSLHFLFLEKEKRRKSRARAAKERDA